MYNKGGVSDSTKEVSSPKEAKSKKGTRGQTGYWKRG